MSFVSIAFLVLLLVTFVLYHAWPVMATQNLLILIASYVFYGWWDWRFLPLLMSISLVNFYAARAIAASDDQAHRRTLLIAALVVGFAALVVFKYFGFFIDSFIDAAALLGITLQRPALSIVLPLGISFITFQGAAYVIDVWRREHAAEQDIVRFLAFKAFFPQLVAGPIERASNLLDQFARPRTITREGIRGALWLLVYGFFLKIVIADSMAALVDSQFRAGQPFAWSVVLGTLAFGVQIYADFMGYSLIAKGAAALFGFELIWNFRYPYWATSISEFWRRWHISLSNWLRDYLYIPLGGNRGGEWATGRNLLITMGLGGLWHGASWNFVYWGLLHGVALAAWRFSPLPMVPSSPAGRALGWAVTMVVVFTGWFLFRATEPAVLKAMVGALGNWQWVPVHGSLALALACVGVPFALCEHGLRRHGDYAVLALRDRQLGLLCAAMLLVTLAMTRQFRASFIYFQF